MYTSENKINQIHFNNTCQVFVSTKPIGLSFKR